MSESTSTNDDFFGIEEDSAAFAAEYEQERQTFTPPEDGEQAEYYDAEEIPSASEGPNEDHEAIARIMVTFFDDTRAIMASLYSGEPKEKYLFYRDPASAEPVIMAAAYCIQKYQMTWGPEVILILALIGSSIYIANLAHKDRKARHQAQQEKAKKEEKIKAM